MGFEASRAGYGLGMLGDEEAVETVAAVVAEGAASDAVLDEPACAMSTREGGGTERKCTSTSNHPSQCPQFVSLSRSTRVVSVATQHSIRDNIIATVLVAYHVSTKDVSRRESNLDVSFAPLHTSHTLKGYDTYYGVNCKSTRKTGWGLGEVDWTRCEYGC